MSKNQSSTFCNLSKIVYLCTKIIRTVTIPLVSSFFMQQLKIVVSDRLKGNTAFMDFAKSLPESFNNIGTEIHTARNRLRIMDISHLGVDGINRVMVKRYHGLFWFQKIDYTFIRQPKCRKAYNNVSMQQKSLLLSRYGITDFTNMPFLFLLLPKV